MKEEDDNEVYEDEGVTWGLKIENLYSFIQFIMFNALNPLCWIEIFWVKKVIFY